jgi:hypothetical protein
MEEENLYSVCACPATAECMCIYEEDLHQAWLESLKWLDLQDNGSL